jgi:hypothetical protein
MPRYFFSARRAGDLAVDPEGTELPDLTAALREAELSLRELVADTIKSGSSHALPDSMVVFDARGEEVGQVSTIEILSQRK